MFVSYFIIASVFFARQSLIAIVTARTAQVPVTRLMIFDLFASTEDACRFINYFYASMPFS